MHCEFIANIDVLDAAEWNRLNRSGCPFTRYEFLHALESSQSVSARTGWQPTHLLLRGDSKHLLAAMPLYLKDNSYGEYVFDWSWANAYQRAGRNYYPKLLSAVPYSPVTGSRLLLADGIDTQAAHTVAKQALTELALEKNLSSIHILFPEKNELQRWQNSGMLTRSACHFQWFNQGYENFDDFLAGFASRKRKNVRKERARIGAQGIRVQAFTGAEISTQLWEQFYEFYHFTYYKRGGAGYLNKPFFLSIAETMPEQLVLMMAWLDQRPIGAALYFRDEKNLYGRYWGCAEEYDCLHFEACYYQGIEYCITNGLQRFDPGVQGEHKLLRGFMPVVTHSCHWLAEPDFSSAIDRFLQEEEPHIHTYRKEALNLLPFNSEFMGGESMRNLLGPEQNKD